MDSWMCYRCWFLFFSLDEPQILYICKKLITFSDEHILCNFLITLKHLNKYAERFFISGWTEKNIVLELEWHERVFRNMNHESNQLNWNKTKTKFLYFRRIETECWVQNTIKTLALCTNNNKYQFEADHLKSISILWIIFESCRR